MKKVSNERAFRRSGNIERTPPTRKALFGSKPPVDYGLVLLLAAGLRPRPALVLLLGAGLRPRPALVLLLGAGLRPRPALVLLLGARLPPRPAFRLTRRFAGAA